MTAPATEVRANVVMRTIAEVLDGTHGLHNDAGTADHYVETDTVFELGPTEDEASTLLRVIDAEGDVVAVYRITVEAVAS